MACEAEAAALLVAAADLLVATANYNVAYHAYNQCASGGGGGAGVSGPTAREDLDVAPVMSSQELDRGTGNVFLAVAESLRHSATKLPGKRSGIAV